MAAEGGVWDFERLSIFIADPKGTVPGTKMAFKGVSKDGDRGNVLAYIRSLSATPAGPADRIGPHAPPPNFHAV